MDEHTYMALVEDLAGVIRENIQNGTLYGRKIDMSNPDVVLVAAYWWCKREESGKRYDIWEVAQRGEKGQDDD